MQLTTTSAGTGRIPVDKRLSYQWTFDVPNRRLNWFHLPERVDITVGDLHSTLRSTTTHSFTYNTYGQITQAVNPLAGGMWNPPRLFLTTHTYDTGPGGFGLPLTTTFMTNNQTTIIERNTLTPCRRSIASTATYENNVRQTRTEFRQDAFGNLVEVREFLNVNAQSDDWESRTQLAYDHRGILPHTIRTYAPGNILLTERQFTYDNMWRVLSETTPGYATSNYITRWEYDRTGRITRIEFPAGGVVTYQYNDQQNTLTHQTILGARYVYQYNGFGNLRTITDITEPAAPRIILTNRYDHRLRLVETRNAEGLPSSQRTTFQHDRLDRVTEVRHLTPQGVVLYRETITYHDVNDTAGNSRIVTTIHGN